MPNTFMTIAKSYSEINVKIIIACRIQVSKNYKNLQIYARVRIHTLCVCFPYMFPKL